VHLRLSNHAVLLFLEAFPTISGRAKAAAADKSTTQQQPSWLIQWHHHTTRTTVAQQLGQRHCTRLTTPVLLLFLWTAFPRLSDGFPRDVWAVRRRVLMPYRGLTTGHGKRSILFYERHALATTGSSGNGHGCGFSWSAGGGCIYLLGSPVRRLVRSANTSSRLYGNKSALGVYFFVLLAVPTFSPFFALYLLPLLGSSTLGISDGSKEAEILPALYKSLLVHNGLTWERNRLGFDPSMN
jgi:hypothetical protein